LDYFRDAHVVNSTAKLGNIYNFISPSQHGSIAVTNKKELINTNKQQY